jgi:hypothetical protein
MPDCQKIKEILGMVVSFVIQRFEKDNKTYEHKMKEHNGYSTK